MLENVRLKGTTSLSIREVSEEFGISPYTLRYYEKAGLLPHVARAESGRRCYGDEDVERLHLICCMRGTGMSIANLKAYIELCMQGDSTIPERKNILLRQKQIIKDHIAEYEKLLAVVNRKLSHYQP